jgi:hypothetical protein
MSFQVDGSVALNQQQNQLQAMETFFVEVIDYNAGDGTKNDVTVKDISGAVASPIQLKSIQAPADLAAIATQGATIVFDRQVFVDGAKKRVAGFRAATA